MSIEAAIISDIPFLVTAIIAAERAHTGKGYWDFYFPLDMPNRDEKLKEMLSLVFEHEESAFFHYSHFFVVREPEHGAPVASILGCMYPAYSLSNMKPAVFKRTMEVLNRDRPATEACTEADCEKFWDNITDIIFGAFPEGPEVDDQYAPDTWVIECVYTDPAHRGRGYSARLMEHIFEVGRTRALEQKALPGAAPCDKTVNDGAMLANLALHPFNSLLCSAPYHVLCL